MKFAWLLTAFVVSCAAISGSSAPSETADETDKADDIGTESSGGGLPPPEGPPEECVDEMGNPVECDFDKDCCEGFYCGLDPQGSTRIKTCVYGGGGD
jgi:hypothetical protein